MKLNNENFWATGDKVNGGQFLCEINVLDIYDHKQPTIYYASGVPGLDKLFGEKGYIKQGYISTLTAYENSVCLFIAKYLRDELTEMAVVHIARDKILRFEEEKSDSLIVLKREDTKHKAKYMFKNASGLVGSLASFAGEKYGVSANTEQVSGTIYKLYFIDQDENESFIEIYSANEFEHSSKIFLNTYYKKELSEAAKKTVKEESSGCFIATACYQDLFSPEVVAFREYRDNVLNRHLIGKLFISFYYKFSPLIYKRIYYSNSMQSVFRKILDKIYRRIKNRNY